VPKSNNKVITKKSSVPIIIKLDLDTITEKLQASFTNSIEDAIDNLDVYDVVYDAVDNAIEDYLKTPEMKKEILNIIMKKKTQLLKELDKLELDNLARLIRK